MDIMALARKVWSVSSITGNARWQIEVYLVYEEGVESKSSQGKNGDWVFYHNTMRTLHNILGPNFSLC